MTEKFDGLIERMLEANMSLPDAIELLERSMIYRVLERNAGNQCAAAKALGIHRNTLQRKMAEFGIGNGKAPRRKPVAKAVKTRKRKHPAA